MCEEINSGVKEMDQKYLTANDPSKWEDLFLNLLTDMNIMPTSIKDVVYNQMGSFLQEQIKLINECQTPIEFLLATELDKELQILNEVGPVFHEILPQSTVWIDTKTKYRVDLLLRSIPYHGESEYPIIIIECDGHEFHERTKEQAQSDKQRDRNLQLSGHFVLRFTGSEIFESPRRCAYEVVRFLEQVIYEKED